MSASRTLAMAQRVVHQVAQVLAPGQHTLSERSRLAEPVGAVPSLSQLRVAPRQSAPAVAGPRSHQRLWLGEDVAAVYASDGSGIDGARVLAQRGAILPGAAVAAPPSAVTSWPGK
jgi:hypothetical protein